MTDGARPSPETPVSEATAADLVRLRNSQIRALDTASAVVLRSRAHETNGVIAWLRRSPSRVVRAVVGRFGAPLPSPVRWPFGVPGSAASCAAGRRVRVVTLFRAVEMSVHVSAVHRQPEVPMAAERERQGTRPSRFADRRPTACGFRACHGRGGWLFVGRYSHGDPPVRDESKAKNPTSSDHCQTLPGLRDRRHPRCLPVHRQRSGMVRKTKLSPSRTPTSDQNRFEASREREPDTGLTSLE